MPEVVVELTHCTYAIILFSQHDFHTLFKMVMHYHRDAIWWCNKESIASTYFITQPECNKESIASTYFITQPWWSSLIRITFFSWTLWTCCCIIILSWFYLSEIRLHNHPSDKTTISCGIWLGWSSRVCSRLFEFCSFGSFYRTGEYNEIKSSEWTE
jgi:hypothetical protein